MKALKNLKSLTLAGNFDITGKYISDLKGLEQLALNNCCSIESQYFQQIFENLKNLLLLDIRNCGHLTTENFQQICDNLHQLKTLKISTTKENINCLAKLPNLKQLEINRNNILSPAITKEFLTNLAHYQAEQLEELKLIDCADFDADKAGLVTKLSKLKVLHCICNAFDDEILEQFSKFKEIEELFISNCYFVSNESVLQLLENCPQLTRLTMRSCGDLTSDVIKKILQIFQLKRGLYKHHVKHIAVKPVLKIVALIAKMPTDLAFQRLM
ncbi:F-box and leucine-rich repeat protein 13-like [Calliphora vicina]|uniref:F-box and leucine-rich repeat protein 13-like n=1 Tax=Calliphora vicina TaxID=7373 RepID=UPI00325A5365